MQLAYILSIIVVQSKMDSYDFEIVEFNFSANCRHSGFSKNFIKQVITSDSSVK